MHHWDTFDPPENGDFKDGSGTSIAKNLYQLMHV